MKCCPCAGALANELAWAEQALRNLVAVIDRDGGQRQVGESVTASGERAKAVVFAERSAMRAQRDEARALVRRYVEAEMDPTDEDGDGRRGSFKASRNAVARWDEEAKRSGSKALREWTERGEADIARWVEEEKKR